MGELGVPHMGEPSCEPKEEVRRVFLEIQRSVTPNSAQWPSRPLGQGYFIQQPAQCARSEAELPSAWGSRVPLS